MTKTKTYKNTNRKTHSQRQSVSRPVYAIYQIWHFLPNQISTKTCSPQKNSTTIFYQTFSTWISEFRTVYFALESISHFEFCGLLIARKPIYSRKCLCFVCQTLETVLNYFKICLKNGWFTIWDKSHSISNHFIFPLWTWREHDSLHPDMRKTSRGSLKYHKGSICPCIPMSPF